ncbi:hypothetical protein ACSI5F_03655 [Ralstonia pseudosolanacearum]|uniref:hypothetical protein n=1 Tax=Ralstonia pseudosolanacearum TaxID=1310165 RepID=UPI003EE22570
MTNLDLNELERLAREATPQDFDSGEIMSNVGEWIDCPHCGGEGAVQLDADYCNYDGRALGVQFYGIGNAHGAAENYYRAARPAVVLAMIARIRELEAAPGLTGDRLTEEKTAHIAQCDGFAFSGYVLAKGDGARCIVEKSAVRWLSKDEMWAVMHPPEAAQQQAEPVCKNGADCSAAQHCVHGCKSVEQQPEPGADEPVTMREINAAWDAFNKLIDQNDTWRMSAAIAAARAADPRGYVHPTSAALERDYAAVGQRLMLACTEAGCPNDKNMADWIAEVAGQRAGVAELRKIAENITTHAATQPKTTWGEGYRQACMDIAGWLRLRANGAATNIEST